MPSAPRLPPASLALGLLAAACGGGDAGAGPERGSVVLAVVESLRADRAVAAPFLDELAATGLAFERAYATSSFAPQSLASVWTGRLPTGAGAVGLVESQPARSLDTLPRALRRAGFETAIVSAQPLVGRPGFTSGFEEIQIDTAPTRWRPAEVTRRALEVADERRGDPLFLVAYYALPDRAREAGTTWAEFVGEADRALSALVEGLESRGVLDDALLVVTSSHGRELGEHGGEGFARTLYEEVVRVPLVLRAPGLRAARALEVVSLVDLASTVRAFVDLPDVAHAAGISLLDPGLRARRGHVLAELVLPGRVVTRAVIEQRWKLVADWTLDARIEEGRDFPTFGPTWGPHEASLYDLAADAREERASPDAGARARLQAALDGYREECERHGAPLPTLHEYASLASGLEHIGYM